MSFDIPPPARLGASPPAGPVVLAVPHGGRDYPAALLRQSRAGRVALQGLEDRLVDLLVGDAVAAGAVAIVAPLPRAAIDLNRAPDEIDATMIDPAPPAGALRATAKVRGGLGLIPRRTAASGELWRDRIAAAEVARRIAGAHEPYHRAIAEALRQAAARFGAAVLIDLHSMPALTGAGAADLVIGDLHGASADADIVAAVAEAAADARLSVARNRPYAGGFTLARHGRPAERRHAFQLEIARPLYLDMAGQEAGEGLARMRGVVAALCEAAASALLPPMRIAAE